MAHTGALSCAVPALVSSTLSCAGVHVLAAHTAVPAARCAGAPVPAAASTALAVFAASPCASAFCVVVFACRSSPSCRPARSCSRQHSTPPLSAQAQSICAGASEAPPCLPTTPPPWTLHRPSACIQTSSSSMTTSRPVSRTSSTGAREARVPPPRNAPKVGWLSLPHTVAHVSPEETRRKKK